MKEKVTTKKAPARKTAVKKTAVEPFAETVEPPGVSSPHVSKGSTRALKKPTETKPATKAVRKKTKKVAVDPFAEIAETEPIAKPIKKRTKKSVPRAVATGAVAKKASVKKTEVEKPALDVTAELAAAEPAVEVSPVFKALADVKLPDLERENRARLQMQSPTRLYFYWSLKEDPWHQLRRVFGADLGAYRLVVKLTDLTRDIEEIHPCDGSGDWWFAVEPGTEYQAEIGFYATNRPYFRVLYSNTVATPLRSPSPHPADESRWTVTATKFAEVLDVSGFSRDAVDVALAGDDVYGADRAAHIAFSRFVGSGEYALRPIAGSDIRYAMAALARGTTLDALRWQIDERLFAMLQANPEKPTSASAQSAITEYFNIDETEFDVEQTGPAVFGASLVNFPRNLKRRGPAPLSSHSVG
jgi:hypothetical protein